MKRLLLALLILALPALAASPSTEVDATPEISWGGDLDGALARSAESGKPVMVYFSYEGCPWCSRMEREVYPDPRVTGSADRFIWVKVPRDTGEKLHRQFTVNEYPTLLALNGSGEKVNRFTGFREADELSRWFSETLERHAKIAAGEPVVDFVTRDETIVDREGIVTVLTPLQDIPMGICVLGDDLWIVQAKQLHQIDKVTGELKSSTSVRGTVSDIATDGEVIFLASFGWTKGEPIYVFHPKSGLYVRNIVNAQYKLRSEGFRTHGIEFQDGYLWLLGNSTLHKVDPTTGDIVSRIRADTQLRALSRSGDKLISAGPEKVVYFDPTTMAIAEEIPTRHRVRGIAADGDALFLVGQPVYDFDRDNNRVLSWPPQMAVFRLPVAREAGQSTRLGD